MVFQIIIVPLHRQKQKNDYEQSQDYLCLDMAKALRLLAWYKNLYKGRAWYTKTLIAFVSFLAFILYLPWGWWISTPSVGFGKSLAISLVS